MDEVARVQYSGQKNTSTTENDWKKKSMIEVRWKPNEANLHAEYIAKYATYS